MDLAIERTQWIFLTIDILVFVAIGGLLIGLPTWGIVDAAMRPNEDWHAISRNKAVWIVLLILFGIVAAPAYFLIVRRRLKRVDQT